MGKVRLVRVDTAEKEEFYLSAAETPIGRGPVLGCDDKRVSRNHGIIQLLMDGGIKLVANHTNPCFYKLKNEDTYVVLMKGQTKNLTFGDEFALLPDSFYYRITMKKDVDNTDYKETDRVMDSSIAHNNTTETDIIHKDDITDTPITNENTTVDENVFPVIVACSSTPVVDHKRNLPAWLTHLPTSGIMPRPLNKTTKRKLHQNQENHIDKKMKTNNQDNHAKENHPNNVISNAEQVTVVKTEAVAIKDAVKRETDRGRPTVSFLHQLSDEDEISKDAKDGYEAEYGDASTNASTGNVLPVSTAGELDSGSNAADPNQGSSTSRESCIYGKDCYRKNPQHRVDFCHPGDADFKVANDDENLPECEYGTSCYRKNVQHRKEFKHTKPWKRPRPPPVPTSNVFCNNCNITYTVCTRCHRTDSETVDLTKEEPNSQ